MKLLQTLDISEGISMDTLKPILNSGAESSYETCLVVKDSPGDDNLLNTEKRSQKCMQKDKSISEKTVESMGSNAKKMFEKVDLNSSLSSDVSLKKDSWSTGSVYSKCSEKENMVENSEMRFDIMSDDESESLHLKISSDEENSSDELLPSKSFEKDHSKINNSEDSKSNGNEHLEPDEDLLGSRDSDSSCKELTSNVSIDVESEEREPSNSALESSPTSISESDHENSTGDLEHSEPCSKVVQPVLGPNSSAVDAIEVATVEEDVEMGTKITDEIEDQSTCSSMKDSKDTISEKCMDHSGSTPEKILGTSDIKEEESDTKKRNLEGEIKSSMKTKIEYPFDDEKSDTYADDDKFVRSEKKAKSAIDDHDMSALKNLKDEEELKNEKPEEILEVMDFTEGNGECDEVRSNELGEEVDVSDSIDEPNEKLLLDELDEGKIEEGIPIGDDQIDEHAENLLLDSGSEDNPSSQVVNPNSFIPRTDSHLNDNSNSDRVSEINVCKKDECGELKTSHLSVKNKFSSVSNSKVLNEGKDLIGEKEGCVVSKMRDLIDQKEGCVNESKDLTDLKDGCILSEDKDLVHQKGSCVLSESKNLIDQEEESVLSKDQNSISQYEGCASSGSKDIIDDKSVLSKSKDLVDDKEGCELKAGPDASSSRKRELQHSPVEALGRKRTSPSSDEKVGLSFKRSKVEKEVCDELSFDSSTSENEEMKISKTKIENRSNKQELSKEQLNKQELSKEQLNKQELSKEQLNKQFLSKTKIEKGSSVLNPSADDNKMEVTEEEIRDKMDVTGEKTKDEIVTTEEKRKDKTDVTQENIKEMLKSDNKVDSKTDLENSDKKLNPLPLLRNFDRAQLKTMTRNDLEELVLQKICEAITERSMCGELRELAVNLDQKLKSWQKKSLQLSKQVKDLSLVLKRYGSDLQSKGPNATPLKITRSVGLQVQMPGSSTGICWHPDDQSWKKGEKAIATDKPTPASTSTVKSVAPNPLPKPTPPPSPAAKVTPNSPAQKVTENSRISTSTAVPQNTLSPTTSIKVLPSKAPVPATPVTTIKTSQKTTIPSVNNRLKPSSDLQVIDLTDNEEKSKSSSNQTPSISVSTDITTVVPAITSSTVTGTVGRPIRVVQHLSGASTALLPQTVTTSVAGRVAYYVPTTTVQQRQLIISNPPVRPTGVMVSNRQNPLPAIVLNSKNIVPVTAVPASNANIIRASNIGNTIQLATPRTPPRTAHYLQRLPIAATSVSTTGVLGSSVSLHPAPLPSVPFVGPSNPNWKLPPPKPDLKISMVPNRNQQGIVLSWNMTITSEYEEIASYQLFAYQEGTAPPSTHLWKKVGDVKALPLPMACTLTQFMEGHKYHFAVRAVDVHARYGSFSTPGNIVLTRK